MSRLITIDCAADEIRIAVGTSGLTGVSLEHVLSCPLELGEKEELLSSPKTMEAMQSLLKKSGVRSGNAIVCVGRGSIELRSLSLPSVDRNELPDMVRFAAQRQFANTGDSWPIDFVTMPSQHENMTECLAASINPNVIDRVIRVLETQGLTLSQLVLRPMASATMAVSKQPALANNTVLFLDLFRDEADMAVVEAGRIVFMRNVRYSQTNDAAANQQVLTSEIKRTMIAAASQRSNLNVEQIRVWGAASQYGSLCQSLSERLSVPVTVLDPLELFDASQSIRNEAGQDIGKYAATVGALLAPQLSDRLIDFSNPRKRVEKQPPLFKYGIAGGVAAALLIATGIWYWLHHASYNSQIAELNAAIKKNDETIKLSEKKLADWNKVESFLQGNRQWLDELEYLSSRPVSAEKVVLNLTTFSTDPRTNSSSITTRFVAKRQDDVPDIQEAFRDETHLVKGTGVNKNPDKTGDFPWAADMFIRLPVGKVQDPRKLGAVSKPVAEVKKNAEEQAVAGPKGMASEPIQTPESDIGEGK